ncbi:MAG TPA: type II secretion system protein, partial [Abditibacteriaceae bacterium]
MKTKSNLQGFTLVEILVVSGIVAMLATLLFAVSACIRENGRKSVCQSNLKQLMVAFQQYVQDNESEYPTWREFIDGFIPHAKNKQVSFCPSHNQSNSSVYS